MAFDRAYPNRKDHRRPYLRRGAAARSCRPHGGCEWCLSSRTHATIKRALTADESLREFRDARDEALG